MRLHGWLSFYDVERLASEQCMPYLNWVTNGFKDGISDGSFSFLLAHCSDGVCWGRLTPDQNWRLSSQVFPKVSSEVSESNLLEVRLFGIDQEVLVWQTEQGFMGRRLTDAPEFDGAHPCQPDDEKRILLGNKYLESQEGFTLVNTARGLQQAIPIECTDEDFTGHRWPLRLDIRHYFDQNEKTGEVRIAASRLKNVFREAL